MDKRDALSRTLAVVGTILVWIPLAAPLVLSVVRFAQAGRLQVDYLMPAELFALAFVGGALLLWAALRARSHRRLTGWSLAAAAGSLVASMAAASLTGLASGATRPVGWPLFLVVALLAAYTLALVVLAVEGVLLARTLLSKEAPQAAGA